MIIKRFFKLILALLVWSLELIARAIWLLLPLGFHMFCLQMRSKVDKLPALTGYFDPESTWQMVYNGVVIVNTNPGALNKRFDNIRKWFINTKWFWIISIVITVVVSLAYIAYKLH